MQKNLLKLKIEGLRFSFSFSLFFYIPNLHFPFTSPPISSSLGGLNKQITPQNQEKLKMLLGKRPRPPMKRTTSLSEITFDIGEPAPVSQHSDNPQNNPFNVTTWQKQVSYGGGGGYEGLDQRLLSMVSPRYNHRRHSADFTDSGHFLRACCLCKRRLVPGRDIYMYRYSL